MSWPANDLVTKEGDLAQLVGLRRQNFIIRLKKDAQFHTHRGLLNHNDLIGIKWGSCFKSQSGHPFIILQPGLADLLRTLPRATQILYPKDIGYILMYMGIGPGATVIEAGTGSGAMSIAFAFAVGESGQVISYDSNPEFQTLAEKNLKKVGLEGRVKLKNKDISLGIDETDCKFIFLDLQHPYNYLNGIRQSLQSGGFLGTILPTANQVIRMISALKQENFGFIEVCDLALRFYKNDPEHFRPADRMVAHTGFLVFARAIENSENLKLDDFQTDG